METDTTNPYLSTGDRLDRTRSLQDLILEAMEKDPRGFAFSLAYRIMLDKDVALALPDNTVCQTIATTMDSIEQGILSRLVD